MFDKDCNMKSLIIGFCKIYSFLLVATGLLFCEEISWSSPPDVLSSTNVNATTPRIVMDPNGNIVAAWIENGFVVSKRKLVAENWSSISTLSHSGAYSLRLSVDGSGNATAIWIENTIVKTATLPFSESWGSVTTLSSSNASSPQLAVDPSGNSVAVWARNGDIESATRLFGDSWPDIPDILPGNQAVSPYVAIGGGTVALVWCDLVSSINGIYSAMKPIGGNWSDAQAISTPNQNSRFAKIAVDANGNAIAVWFRFDPKGTINSNVIAQTASKTVHGDWTSPMDLSSPGCQIPADAFIGINSNGNALALWNLSFDGSSFDLQFCIKPADENWLRADWVTQNNLYSCNLDMVLLKGGDVFVVYLNCNPFDANMDIQIVKSSVNSYKKGCWSASHNLSTGNRNAYPRLSATVSESTIHAAAIWENYNGVNTIIHFVEGTGTILQPPLNLSITQSVNYLGVFNEYYNTLSWSFSTSPDAAGYAIYRNGIFINVVDAKTSSYIDHNRKQNESVTYSIGTVDANYSQSESAIITFP